MADLNIAARQEGERKVLLRKAMEAIDSLQSRLEIAERSQDEPIAVVGLSCRFPGADNPEAYWKLLSHGVDAIKEVPPDRWDKDAYYDPDPSAPGKMHAPFGGFLDQVDRFDAGLFGISGREAESMDPQQRLLLEVTWEALENAGIAANSLRGSPTGVFVGITTSDYARLAANSSASLDVYTATGGALNVAAGRLSFVFGFTGPSIAIDTACSSSLVAVHLACQSLRARECDLALAGGVNMLLTPEPFVCFAKWGMMAMDGRCKTFDERADGFVRAEGCGVVALKRLHNAVAAGDRIMALIRGSAVNQDGASSGLTVPNGLAQQSVVRAALKAARIQPEDVDYVEAHGTGTAIGDPIELEALAKVLGKNRPTNQPLRVGSVKTNLGHLESAAGIAGLIKVVLSMGHQEIPPQLHFQKLSSRISLGQAPIEICTQTVSWPRSWRPRLAGVSSFGFSGTNAHVVLEEPPPEKQLDTEPAREDRSVHLFVLSADTEPALKELALTYSKHFGEGTEQFLADICHSAMADRSPLSHRLAFSAPEIAIACKSLNDFALGQLNSELVHGRVRSDSRVAFLFAGQGTEQRGAGRTLYETEPIFRNAIEECAVALTKHCDRPLLKLLHYVDHFESEIIPDEIRYSQPALFALEYALASLWRSWGIEASAILGHGVGEYVGACIAGAMALEDAISLVAFRSRLIQNLPRDGAIARVFSGQELVRKEITSYADLVAIAEVNSPQNTVISGRSDAIHRLIERFRSLSIDAQLVSSSHALHSPLVEPILGELERFAEGLPCAIPKVDMISTLTGHLVDEDLPLNARYWRRQLREPIQFQESLRTLHTRGIRTFLEVGPSSTLARIGRQCLQDSETTWLTSLNPAVTDHYQMLSSLGALFVSGATPDWRSYDKPYRRKSVTLPNYQFQRKRHWIPVSSPDPDLKRTDGHPLLGTHVPLAFHPGEHIWFGEISLEKVSWIDDHRVQGVSVVPATAYVEMAIAAAVEAISELPVVLTRIDIARPLQLKSGRTFEIQTRLAQQGSGIIEFQIHSRRKNRNTNWTLHATGALRTGEIRIPDEKWNELERVALQRNLTRSLDGSEFYRLQSDRGNQWGPCFQGVTRIWQGNGEALSEVTIPIGIEQETSSYVFHPALADSLGHILTATIPLEKSNDALGGAFVGAGIDEVRLYRRPEGRRFYAYAKIRGRDSTADNTLVGDVKVFDLAGNLITETIGARLWYLDSKQQEKALRNVQNWLYEPRWIPSDRDLERAPDASATGTWVIFRDRQGVGDALCARLRGRGATCLCVDYGDQFSRSGEALITIRRDQASDYDQIFSEARKLTPELKRVVHLWSLDAQTLERADLAALQDAQSLGPISVLRVAQSLDRLRLTVPPKLWLITAGAQPADSKPSPISLLQSPLWGFGRAIAMECSDFWGGQLDLDPSDTPDAAADMLAARLEKRSADDQFAFRGGREHVLRLGRRSKMRSTSDPISIRPDANYLLTGGLGGIGLVIADWLVAHGARHLTLAGRTAMPSREQWNNFERGSIEESRIAAIRELEKRGANVQTKIVDMGNEESVRELVNQCLLGGQPPLRGVFHAAGVMQYEPFCNQTPQQIRDVLAPKMIGGWLLHRFLATVPLELFVLFSSSSALLGSPMMGGYSAANVFLDTLAHHRRAMGLPALSVNWGTWEQAGMATRFQTEQESKRHGRTGATKGIGTLSNQEALEAMELFLDEGDIQVGVMPIDWKEWRRSYGDMAIAPYLSLLVSGEGSTSPAKSADVETRERILATNAGNRSTLVQDYLKQVIARILKVPIDSVEPQKPISAMGFDSLMSIELKNQIDVDLGVSVAMAQLIQGPTPAELTEWITELLATMQTPDMSRGSNAPVLEFEEGVL